MVHGADRSPQRTDKKRTYGQSGMVCEWCRSFTPKGQTRKEPSLHIQVWYVNGADHLPQRTDKKEPSLDLQVWDANVQIVHPQRTDK